MRIFFDSMTLPKKAAKRLQKHFSPEYGSAMRLAAAQQTTASMLGYESWHELEQVTAKCKTPSPLDEDASEAEQKARIDFQAEKLNYITPLIDIVCRQVTLKLRVSARNPNSTVFSEDGNNRGYLRFWVDPYSGREEWRYFPSSRSEEIRELILGIEVEWMSGDMVFGVLEKKLSNILTEQPENFPAWTLWLYAMDEVGALWHFRREMLRCEKELKATIPKDYPRRQRVYFEWGTVENRDYLRCILALAEMFYQTGRYAKAKHWFNFANKAGDLFIDFCRPYLADLRLNPPIGRVHEMDDDEIDALLSKDEEEIERLREYYS